MHQKLIWPRLMFKVVHDHKFRRTYFEDEDYDDDHIGDGELVLWLHFGIA